MFIEFYNTQGQPVSVSLLQLKGFSPQEDRGSSTTVLIMGDSAQIIINSAYDAVKQQIQAVTRG